MGRPPNPIDPNGSFAEHYGWKIRTLREERGWSLEELAAKVVCSAGHLSKLERALKSPDKQIARLLDQALDTTYFTEHWLLAARDRIPRTARSLAEHEAEAERIQSFMPTLVVGLLQTEAYTRALVLSGLFATDADEITAERMRRQEILKTQDPPFLLAIMDEMALRRPVGGAAVLKEQLAYLLEIMAEPHIAVQAVRFRTAVYPGLVGGVTLLEPKEGAPVAYVEGPAGLDRIVRSPDQVARTRRMFDVIRSVALSAGDTADLITEIMEEL